jgi:hypothetical protein
MEIGVRSVTPTGIYASIYDVTAGSQLVLNVEVVDSDSDLQAAGAVGVGGASGGTALVYSLVNIYSPANA